jgi:hypothetical protein
MDTVVPEIPLLCCILVVIRPVKGVVAADERNTIGGQ